ncbi:uncharacterized protein LOC126376415 [Pectinophora gossypiella]|uniref:uncharacterized protein LOC126376415 n=1 Tax=Pectinophora gossypiella TaxID=13191 RepID=UPI00214E40C8|nr:uncharacterized protein LOC126376415 [Pectinophora gossypiella]
MERLPNEVLLLVFQWLRVRDRLVAARVCRRWAALALRAALHVQRRQQQWAASAAHTAVLLTARGAELRVVLQRAPLLRELTVHARLPLTAADRAALLRLPHLDHLDVFHRERVIGASSVAVALRLSSLVINDTVAPGVLRALGAGRLRALHMYGRAAYFPRRDLPPLLRARRLQLRELTLRCAELPDAAYAALGACTGLEALRLYSCWLLTSAGAAHVVRPPALRVLHLTGARMLRPTPLQEFLRSLPPRLEELVLSAGWFGDEHVPALAASASELRVLELWRCPLSAAGVCAAAAALPRLWELDVDTELGAEELRRLAAHGALARLRCRAAAGGGAAVGAGAAPWALAPAAARYGRGALRGGGEGWRSELFYHWSSSLRPLPERAPPPSFDDDDEDDYSLLDVAPPRY